MDQKNSKPITYRNFDSAYFVKDLNENILMLRTVLDNTMDLNIMPVRIDSIDCAVITIEGMVSTSAMAELIFRPLTELDGSGQTPQSIMDFLCTGCLMSNERILISDLGQAARLLFSGFALIIVDRTACAAAFGIQGYEKKAISSPMMENNVMGSQEAFTEVVRTNISLIRRRIKHPSLRFEMMQIGELSNTDVCLVYIRGRTDEKMVAKLRSDLKKIKLDCILGTGYIMPFIEPDSPRLLFSQVGFTERPDMLCENIIRGRIGILIDGNPFCLICPYMFSQNFASADDAASKTYFTFFMKLIRYIAFFLATAFPGIYLAAVNYDPEMLNAQLLSNLSASEKTTMLPLFSETLIIMLLLEVMREASIRLPRAVGAAMSIAGGLIIGDAAVKSGLISSPLLIIVGITATASFVLPSINQQMSTLRIMFILAGGFAGFFGITACALMTAANICSADMMGIAYTSPIAPFIKGQAADVFARMTFEQMQDKKTTINDFS